MGSITLLTALMVIFALHFNGVVSTYIRGYGDKDAPVETGHHNSPMNYIPGELPQAAHPEYMMPEEMVEGGSRLPEIIIAEKHHRRRRRRCKDRSSQEICYQMLLYGRCEQKRARRKCRRTCGICEDERECRDLRTNCMYASVYTCSQPWFAQGCRSSCNLCETKTTTEPTTTTTTAGPGQECKDIRSNCAYATKYTCSYWRVRWGCKKSCGVCVPEQTTTASTTTITTTEPSPTTTSTATTEPSSSTSPARTTATHQPPQTSTTTIATLPTTSGTTSEPQPPTLEPETVQTTIATTTTSVSMTTTTNGSGSTDKTSQGTIEPLLCVDQDEKNCHIWESLGLCYNPKFMEDTIKICPFSCKACTPDGLK